MPEADRAVLAILDPDGAFRHRLATDRQQLAGLIAGLWTASPTERQGRFEAIEALAHRLAGAAGTFGFDAIGEAALSLEDVLIEQREGLLTGERALLEAHLASLLSALA